MKHIPQILAGALAAALIMAPVALSAKGEAEKGDAEKGKEVFQQCSVCHYPDKKEKKMGPGLKGLFKKEKLHNGKAATEKNIREVINKGGSGMPAYEDLLTAEEKDDLVAYLKTL